MRLAPKRVLIALVALAPLAGAAQPEAPFVAPGEAPTRPDVRKALDEVANDPNLSTVRTINTLRWKEREAVTEEPWWFPLARWSRGLFGWIAESGRLLVWVVGALAVGLLASFIARLVRERGLPRVPKQFVAPSHVRDLDIRPESLPDDVGAAALALWEGGEQRAALALLYRGTLSRLVHVHAVPIRASSTEGECLALARPRLAESSARYAASLVEVWTAAVYGAREPAADTVQALCGEFAAALDAKVPA
ncbi:MAG TPA: DUF4129 domain-containing protein [Gammaproteobacteria bacterium]|nr:DUF4129 domain-containing protein [Gammaproteobacteria bacterium]